MVADEGAKGPAVGAKFKGDNSRAGDKSGRRSRLSKYSMDPPKSFIFDISWHRLPGSRAGNIKSNRPIKDVRGNQRHGPIDATRYFESRGDSDGFIRAEFTRDSIRSNPRTIKGSPRELGNSQTCV